MRQKILDPCCGGRMFWFDKHNPNVIFGDIRNERHILCDGRKLEVKPDKIMDFRNLEYPDKTFKLVVFDPPHLKGAGRNGWMAKKYGVLDKDTWRDDLRRGFSECWRVLKKDGILIFKWNEHSIKLKDIRDLFPADPLFGHTTNNKGNTHWICFMKL
ncbi:MAG: SAM-dependent methyltransferase [Negativicutes bacterium]|nr:SAM-dependent methyltransferase [Negativicutes bacterium]